MNLLCQRIFFAHFFLLCVFLILVFGIPVFNPLITKGGVFEADEYDQGRFLEVLGKVLVDSVDEKGVGWKAWDTEMAFDIVPHLKRSSLGEFEFFDFKISIGQACLKDAELVYGFQHMGVNLCVTREDSEAFYQELKNEMALFSELVSLSGSRED